MTEPADHLVDALEVTEHLIASVRDDQWTAPTPCPEWSVRDLVDHVTSGNRLLTSILSGKPMPQDGPDDPLNAYREASAALLAAFRRPGIAEEMFTVPFGTVPGTVTLHLRITEVLVHGWDLARATEQPAGFAEEVAERELAFSRDKITEIPPGRTPFAAPQPVAEDAPAIDRLAACLGRRVTADGS